MSDIKKLIIELEETKAERDELRTIARYFYSELKAAIKDYNIEVPDVYDDFTSRLNDLFLRR